MRLLSDADPLRVVADGPLKPDLSTLNLFLIEHVGIDGDVHDLRRRRCFDAEITFWPHTTAIMESTMSDDDVVGVHEYEGAAAGWGALKAVADAVRGQMAIVKETRGLLSMNQPHGFDCPGCAWPDPKHTSSFEFCENLEFSSLRT